MISQKNIWDILYNKGLSWKKNNKIDENLANKSVLELGVGNGKTLQTIINQNPLHVTAIDISKEAITKAKLIDSKNVNYITKDFLEFNTKNKFEVIVCYYFLNNFRSQERVEVVKKIKFMLAKNGTILFEDFGIGDYRQKGKEIEENTIQKSNGLICHFFTKNEIKKLFKGMNVKIKERIFSPIRTDKSLRRKIIKAIIKDI